jgi:hypothetical protein
MADKCVTCSTSRSGIAWDNVVMETLDMVA